MLNLTDRAQAAVAGFMARGAGRFAGLRIGVRDVTCSGVTYARALTESAEDDDLRELRTAEEFLDYFGIIHDPDVVAVNRLRYLQAPSLPLLDDERRDVYAALLERAYDFRPGRGHHHRTRAVRRAVWSASRFRRTSAKVISDQGLADPFPRRRPSTRPGAPSRPNRQPVPDSTISTSTTATASSPPSNRPAGSRQKPPAFSA